MPVFVKGYIREDLYKTTLSNGRQELLSDEPADSGGGDLGFSPAELLCSALVACTCITLRMYANRKHWKLEEVKAEVQYEQNKENGESYLQRSIELCGDLSEEERGRLLVIANKCPVHKIFSNTIHIKTTIQ